MNAYWRNGLNDAISGAMSGAASLSALGGWASAAGAVVGGVFGIITGINRADAEKNALIADVKGLVTDRNKLIDNAQMFINNTRSDFDSTYGAGMYDRMDNLYSRMFMNGDTNTLSSILGSMQMDLTTNLSTEGAKYNGGNNSLSYNFLKNTSVGGSITDSDIANGYLNALSEDIAYSDSIVGKQLELASLQENMALKQYNDSMRTYFNNDLQNRFVEHFNNSLVQNISGESALGQAENAQANSGIRQTGSGKNLTATQRFQNNLTRATYSSMLNYYIKSAQNQATSASEQIVNSLYTSRANSSITKTQSLQNLVASVNQANMQNKQYYQEISSTTAAIKKKKEDLADDYDYSGTETLDSYY